MDSKKRLGVAAVSLAAAAAVLGTASTARADEVIICDPCGPVLEGPMHKINAMSKTALLKIEVMQKVNQAAFSKIQAAFGKFTEGLIPDRDT